MDGDGSPQVRHLAVSEGQAEWPSGSASSSSSESELVADAAADVQPEANSVDARRLSLDDVWKLAGGRLSSCGWQAIALTAFARNVWPYEEALLFFNGALRNGMQATMWTVVDALQQLHLQPVVWVVYNGHVLGRYGAPVTTSTNLATLAPLVQHVSRAAASNYCLLYTSDAADE